MFPVIGHALGLPEFRGRSPCRTLGSALNERKAIMQNKFGLKDFVLLVLVAAVGLSVWVAMFQRDSQKNDLQRTLAKLGEVTSQLARIESRIESGGGAA